MSDSIIGFSPNWYEGQNNAGLGIFIATGSINGVEYNGAVYTLSVTINPTTGLLDAPVTIYIWLTASGETQQGLSGVPAGLYPIAKVTVGNILTGTGVNVYAVQVTKAPGIQSIVDLRPITQAFSFS